MIARIWHGMVPTTKSEDYLQRMRKVALPDYKSTPGNRGAWCLHRVEGDVAHFDMLTYWDDLPPATVATRLGIGEGSVRRHLARARKQLRTVLDE